MKTDHQTPLTTTLASLIAIAGFIFFSINAPSSTISFSPNIKVTAQLDRTFITPYGPSVFISIQTPERSQPITSLYVTLDFSGGWVGWGNSTVTNMKNVQSVIDYPSVTKTKPLLPSGSVSQKISYVGYYSLEDDIIISGTYADGSTFQVKTYLNWIE